ncbi:MAG TPA: TetR/AcrR family transcriptional regulator [Polyangiales bacterium]|nr:TetR/AcrR family transcriptional regulator [Polyangiales bacterium]
MLREAAHLFSAKGYMQTTVRDIAKAVGILSGSLFHHFESKEEILEAVMLEVSARNTERMQQATLLASGPLGRVHALVRTELDSIHGETGEAMTLLVSEWRSLSEAAQRRVLVQRDAYEAVWLDALREAHRELMPMDPFILRRLIQGMTAGSKHWYRARGPLTLDALASQIVSLVTRKESKRGRDARA